MLAKQKLLEVEASQFELPTDEAGKVLEVKHNQKFLDRFLIKNDHRGAHLLVEGVRCNEGDFVINTLGVFSVCPKHEFEKRFEAEPVN